MSLPSRKTVVYDYLKPLFNNEEPEFSCYWDKDNIVSIDMATWNEWPEKSNVVISTLNLSQYDEYKYGKLYTDAKTEFLGVCRQKYTDIYQSILATCVFCVVKGRWFCAPNAIFPDVIKIHNVSDTMQHVFFDSPFLWPESLSCVSLDGIRTGWLMTIPISDAEYQYAIDHSVEALGDLLEKHDIDYRDIHRKSVI